MKQSAVTVVITEKSYIFLGFDSIWIITYYCRVETYVNFFVRVIKHSNQKVQCNQHGSEAVCCKQKLSCNLGDFGIFVGVKARKIHMPKQCPK